MQVHCALRLQLVFFNIQKGTFNAKENPAPKGSRNVGVIRMVTNQINVLIIVFI